MKIVLIGAGNLGTHLGKILHKTGHKVLQVFSRQKQKAKDLSDKIAADPITTLTSLDPEAEVVLIAVSDGAIEHVAYHLDGLPPDAVVAHSAGSIPSTVLSRFTNHGVFYPLQTFSADRVVDWTSLPLLLTGNHNKSMSILESLARSVSDNVHNITDDERLHLHLCATIANNFANHMFTLAHAIANREKLDFSLLKPLIRETAAKVMELDPKYAQTGPALRGDQVTMQKHLDLLSESSELQELYRVISKSIQESITGNG